MPTSYLAVYHAAIREGKRHMVFDLRTCGTLQCPAMIRHDAVFLEEDMYAEQ